MGVRGMETFLEKYSNACYMVNIIDAIRQYRKEHHTTPVIVIDGMSIMRFVYKFKNLSWIYGGQLKEYEECLKEFIYAFLKEGAELVFFFDGPCVSSKTETWIKRRLDTLEKIYNMLDDLSRGGRISNHENGHLFILPANLRFLSVYIAKKCGCKVFNSVRECDLEIAEYAARNNCMAILAQDSDFVIFDSAKYYWSMKNFDFKKMTTLNYDRQKLASTLGITTSHLPLLATLLGNDIISFDELRPFHNRILNLQRKHNNKKWIDFAQLITRISHFIKPIPCGFTIDSQHLDSIAQKVFYDQSKASVIQESLLSYDLSAEINKDIGCPISVNKNWRKILKKLHELHRTSDLPPTLYGIIIQQRYTCSTCVEDYRLTDLPASQTILKPLRKRLYGVLLFEKPGNCEIEEGVVIEDKSEVCEIEEMVVCGPNSLDEPVFEKPIMPKVHHPGLLALWSSDSFKERWDHLGDMFEVGVEQIKTLPSHLVVPALTLNYLHRNVQIENWEMKGIVSSVVLVQIYNGTFLSKIDINNRQLNTRPLRLFTLVSRSYSTTSMIFQALGNPLPLEMVIPTNYQDGKLFHLKYWQSSQGSDLKELCDNKEVAIQHFGQLMSFICD